jgi:flagellar secretion chaperone FliS
MQRSAADVYKTQSIMTAPPAKLVAMCYDRAIMALRDTMRSIDAKDIQGRFNHSTRAASIIAHLWGTLDMEQGGEVAKNLIEIYGYAMRRVQDINMSSDKAAAEDVISVLVPLSRSWNELANWGEEMPMAMPKAPPPPRRLPPQPVSGAAGPSGQPSNGPPQSSGISISA